MVLLLPRERAEAGRQAGFAYSGPSYLSCLYPSTNWTWSISILRTGQTQWAWGGVSVSQGMAPSGSTKMPAKPWLNSRPRQAGNLSHRGRVPS